MFNCIKNIIWNIWWICIKLKSLQLFRKLYKDITSFIVLFSYCGILGSVIHDLMTGDPGHWTLLTSSLGQCLGRTDWGKVKTRLTSFNSDDEMGQGQKKLTRYNRFQNWIFHLTMRYSEIRFDAWTTFFVDSSTILNLKIVLFILRSKFFLC